MAEQLSLHFTSVLKKFKFPSGFQQGILHLRAWDLFMDSSLIG